MVTPTMINIENTVPSDMLEDIGHSQPTGARTLLERESDALDFDFSERIAGLSTRSRGVREVMSDSRGEGLLRNEYHNTKKNVMITQRQHVQSSSGEAASSQGSFDRRSGGKQRVLVKPSVKRAEVDFIAANK